MPSLFLFNEREAHAEKEKSNFLVLIFSKIFVLNEYSSEVERTFRVTKNRIFRLRISQCFLKPVFFSFASFHTVSNSDCRAFFHLVRAKHIHKRRKAISFFNLWSDFRMNKY